MSAFHLAVEDDGLFIPTAHHWSLDKFQMVRYYDDIFSNSMRKKWNIIYLDLFAGAGYARIQETGQIVMGSPLLALDVEHRFAHYVFCEKSPKRMKALRTRVERDFPQASVGFFTGDCNSSVDAIVEDVLRACPDRRFLAFCFIDPYNLGIHFSTISALERAFKRVDFMVLLALWMDARRNESRYVRAGNQVIDRLVGDSNWRMAWGRERRRGCSFGKFVADRFALKMFELDYWNVGDRQMQEFRTSDRRVPLYHLAYFSKDKLGYKYWYEVMKRATSRPPLLL